MSNGRGGIEDISLLRILFTVDHIAILLPAQTNLSEKKMEARRKSSWTKCYNSSSNTHTPHTHPTSSAAAAVSSRNNVFPKTQLRKDLLLGFLNLQLTQVYHSSFHLRSCWALLALCYSCLTHSLAHAPSVIITAVGKFPLMRVKGQHL